MEIDLPKLVQRVLNAADREWPGAVVESVQPLPGGYSSLTYSATLTREGAGAQRVVIKAAPPGLPAVRNRDVLRQARLMRALGAAQVVPLPQILLAEDGDPPWFVMTFHEGDSYEPQTELAGTPPPPEIINARAHRAAHALADMQGVQPEAIGLGDEMPVDLESELERWHRAFETVDESLRPGDQQLHDRLADRMPEALPPVIVHGDYRLGNVLFRGDTLTAIIDWEIWTVGDPRLDLAWLLMYADYAFAPPKTHDDPAFRAAAHAMPSPAELLQEYATVRPGPVEDLAWFSALANYKTAAAVALLAKNARKRGAEPGTVPGEQALQLFIDRGHEHLEGSAVSR
jgi:aminoglycoside phosphotransferase (APT) family kinase protein